MNGSGNSYVLDCSYKVATTLSPGAPTIIPGLADSLPPVLPYLLGFAAVVFVAACAAAWWSRQQRRPQKPDWHGFTQMEAMGVLWSWHWSPAGGVAGLRLRCPDDLTACDLTKPTGDESPHVLRCAVCGRGLVEFESGAAMRTAVVAEIERRIVSGEWALPTAADAV